MNTKLVVLSVLLAVTVAMPRYVLVPLEQLQRLEPAPHVRVARQAVLPDAESEQLVAASDDRFVRQSEPSYGGPDQVDYGAYTGGQGAFGWYAGYPVGGRR
ncbi:uncharacterized protein LOC119100889 [Pollicipes pollicipes]|uniref:uncharacterized protein LOC119100889 n=1 Tax=Pollicipes pollicipes TaxID=41117 RepID=UPI0018856EE6|nr:uncharacterized protein LOC119100889 [Pollicipes pollicipes]